MRHEDVDQHDVEIGRSICPHPGVTAIRNGDLETLALETNFDGDADHWVVIDHENTRHDGSFCSAAAGRLA